jgi:hypothetical protein
LALQQRRLDELQAKNEKKRILMQQLQAKMGEEPGWSVDETSKTRVIENRLDKIMIKFTEALSIKKTYEVILKKFSEEKSANNSQLNSIERNC